jgi:hypothetical protein
MRIDPAWRDIDFVRVQSRSAAMSWLGSIET